MSTSHGSAAWAPSHHVAGDAAPFSLLGTQEWLQRGELVEILPQYAARPLALNLVYAHRRHLPVRVRVVMDWLAEVITAQLSS